MAGPIQLTTADFLEIKQALIEYLDSTQQFPGLDFQGSNIQVILDTLAYQQQLNAYVANMVANESTLESAVVRKNVVSQAKSIGYTPVSARSAKTIIDFQFTLSTDDYPSGLPQSITLKPGMSFSTSGGKGNFLFNCIDQQTASVRNDGLVYFNDVEIYEGVYLTAEFEVDNNNYEQRFLLDNKNIDFKTIRVEVQEDPSEELRTFYTPADNLVLLTEESRKYWIEESSNGSAELIFGDNLFGYKPANGAKIFVTYLVSSGPLANGIQNVGNFKFVGQVMDTYGISLVELPEVTSVATTFGGADIESISSIKYRAPRSYSAQNRAVVAEDYDTIIRGIFPPVDDIYIYGGETKEIPEYGRVYIVIKPSTGKKLSNITKNYIKKSLEPFRVASIDIIITDPDILYVEVESHVFYDEKKTIKDNTSIRATVLDALTKYHQSTSSPKFGGALKYSEIVGIIDDADIAITRNNTSFTMRKDLSIVPSTTATYKVDFRQQIKVEYDRSVIHSTGFTLEIEGKLDPRTFYFENDPTTIRYLTDDNETSERLVSDVYAFYINEFNEKVRVNFYQNKYNELVVVDVRGDDQEITPFGMMSFGYIDTQGFARGGVVELGYRFKLGINIVSTVEASNIIQIRATPKEMDVFADESVFLQVDPSRSNIQASVDTKITGS